MCVTKRHLNYLVRLYLYDTQHGGSLRERGVSPQMCFIRMMIRQTASQCIHLATVIRDMMSIENKAEIMASSSLNVIKATKLTKTNFNTLPFLCGKRKAQRMFVQCEIIVPIKVIELCLLVG